MDVTITPRILSGSVTPPPSKSQAHRLLIAAALAEGESLLAGMARSQDIDATIGCLTQLGARFFWQGESLSVVGIAASPGCLGGKALTLDCGESGSTLRFLIPLALALADAGRFTGRGRLLQRPQGPYAALFAAKGIAFTQSADGIAAKGRLTGGEYALPGDVSSQFFTGLLFALPLLEADSTLVSTTPLESAAYVELTLRACALAGVRPVQAGEGRWRISGNARYRAFSAEVERDWSQAAFWYAAAFAGCPVAVCGMEEASAQGDRAILSQLARMKGDAPAEIDLSACPDLLPPAAAAAALRKCGAVTRFTHAARLRLKESDRLSSVAAALAAMGGRAEETPDSLTVFGAGRLPGGCTIDACNDHRIAMLAAIAACGCEAPVTVAGGECVAKSYPDFWDVYERLGGSLARKGG